MNGMRCWTFAVAVMLGASAAGADVLVGAAGEIQVAQDATSLPPVQTSPSIETAPSPPASAASKKKAARKPVPPSVALPAEAAAAQSSGKANPVPPIELVVLMMRSSLISLDQANKTNNYAVFRALAGPNLQAHSVDDLSKTFAVLRSQQIDLSPILVTKPRMTANPAIGANGNLHLSAIFPTKPLSIASIIEMEPVAGFWRLAGITINLVPAADDAPPVAGLAPNNTGKAHTPASGTSQPAANQ